LIAFAGAGACRPRLRNAANLRDSPFMQEGTTGRPIRTQGRRSPLYERTTRDIRVAVLPAYIEDQSEPDENRFLWSYTITIENKGQETVQLVSRYWHISDSAGRVQEVRGPGVVGAQPVLEPGQTFEYTSGCPLPTASGAMVGRYQMRAASGEAFEIDIPMFLLESPHEHRQIH
jgi:ApaG protein